MNINMIPTYSGTPDSLNHQDYTGQGDFAADMAGYMALLASVTDNASENNEKPPEENPVNEIALITAPVNTLEQPMPALPLPAGADQTALTADGKPVAGVPAEGGDTAAESPLIKMMPETDTAAAAADVPDELATTAAQVRDAVSTVRQDPDNRMTLVSDKARNAPPASAPQPAEVLSGKPAEPVIPVYGNMQTDEPVVSHENTLAEKTTLLPAGIAETRPATITPAASAPVPVSVLPQTTGTAEWQKSLGQQVALFARNGIQHAELRLHPEELGAVQISMRMNNERMHIHFIAEHAHARDALENALPNLRQSLNESGIQLGQSHIGADSGTTPGDKRAGTPERIRKEDPDIQEEHEDPAPATQLTYYRNGINTFA